MPAVAYCLFFNNQRASRQQLDRVEEITVEQQVDMAWEARLLIPICVNGDGRWEGEQEAWMQAFERVRIEVKVGDREWTPLIDGPIVGYDTERSPIPGKSLVTLVVHDDSALLNRDEEVAPYDGIDSRIAEAIFGDAQLGGAPQVDKASLQPDSPYDKTFQRETRMQFLRRLARRQRDFHAYVLPGRQPGQSIGCFKRFPTQPDGLPPLILLGEGRNLASFELQQNARSAAHVTAATLSINGGQITTARSSDRDPQLLGDQLASGRQQPAQRLAAPGLTDAVDPEGAASGEANRSRLSMTARGSVLPLCYPGVLSPYRVVPIKLSDTQLSGRYIVTQVTHTLTRSHYTQSFTLQSNSVSEPSGSSGGEPAAAANPSAVFNIQTVVF